MNTIRPTSRGRGFPPVSEILLLVLFAVSVWQIALCLDASRGLLKPSERHAVSVIGPVIGTNAPASGERLSRPMSQSTGFPFGAKRG